MRQPGDPNKAVRGSATVEFILMVPFVLAMAGLVWDVREYIGHRTDLAREMYVIAEMIASEPAVDPLEAAARHVTDILGHRGHGTVSVALVRRGDRRDAAAAASDPACADPANWCLPRVSRLWSAGVWGDADDDGTPDGGDCAGFAHGGWPGGPGRLPDAGDHLPADQVVLPLEVIPDTPAGPRPPSQTMLLQEWWAVVDICLHADPGLFGGVVFWGLEFFDVSDDDALVLRRRAVWGSPHNWDDCPWCEP